MVVTGSRLITANATQALSPRQEAEVASTEAQHRAAAAYHFAIADKAKEEGKQSKYELHDGAGAQHLAAADRPKGWVNIGDSYPIELAHMNDAASLSNRARNASIQAHKLEDVRKRR